MGRVEVFGPICAICQHFAPENKALTREQVDKALAAIDKEFDLEGPGLDALLILALYGKCMAPILNLETRESYPANIGMVAGQVCDVHDELGLQLFSERIG